VGSAATDDRGAEDGGSVVVRVSSWSSARTGQAVVVVNVAGAVAAAAFATRGLLRPEYVRPGASSSPLAEFWAASSAVRTWAVAVPLLGGLLVTGRVVPQLLTVAGLVQLGDSALGIWQRKTDMAVAPAVMGLIHLASARHLSR
jgi:hypothetical protein